MKSIIGVLMIASVIWIVGCEERTADTDRKNLTAEIMTSEDLTSENKDTTAEKTAEQNVSVMSKAIALPFGGRPEKNRKLPLNPYEKFEPAGNTETRLSVKSRLGDVIIRPETEDVIRKTGIDTYRGHYEVVLIRKNNESEVIDRLTDLEMNINRWSGEQNIGIVDFESFELVYFVPAPGRHHTNMYAYVIENTGKAYPAHFEYMADNQLERSRFFNIDDIHQTPSATDDQNFSVLYGNGEDTFYQLVFTPDLPDRVLRLQSMKDMSAVVAESKKMAQILVDVIAREWKNLSEEDVRKYRGLFTEAAWNNKGFQYIYQNSPMSKWILRLEYAVGIPQHIRQISSETIRFTTSFNLLDIFHQMAYIDVEIQKQADRWIFQKLGKVEIKEVKDYEMYKRHNLTLGLVPGVYE